MCGVPKRNCLGPQQPPPQTQSPLGFAARKAHWFVGTYLPGTGILGWGPGTFFKTKTQVLAKKPNPWFIKELKSILLLQRRKSKNNCFHEISAYMAHFSFHLLVFGPMSLG